MSDEMDRHLIDRWLDGLLDARGHAQLDERLATDPELRRALVLRVDLDRELCDCYGGQPATAAAGSDPTPPLPPAHGSRRRPLATLIAASTALALAVALWYGLVPTAEHTPSLTAPVVEVDGSVSVQREGVWEALVAGSSLQQGDRVATGTGARVRLGFDDGASGIDLGPGSELVLETLVGATRLRLERGHVLAEVASQPEDGIFSVATPRAEVVVVGTVFALRDDGSASRLEVRRGVVRFEAAGAEPLLVEAGAYAEAADGAPLRSGDLRRLDVVADHESTSLWRQRYSDPCESGRAEEAAWRGRFSLRMAYAYRPPPEGLGYAILMHPLGIDPEHRSLGCRVRVVRADPGTWINLTARLADGSAWLLGETLLSTRPVDEWFTLAVPVREALKKNSDTGGDRYEPEEVITISFSIYGGSALLFLDDLALGSEDAKSLERRLAWP